MHDEYEAPAVEDRTAVEVPLNTLINSDSNDRTPVWRTPDAED